MSASARGADVYWQVCESCLRGEEVVNRICHRGVLVSVLLIVSILVLGACSYQGPLAEEEFIAENQPVPAYEIQPGDLIDVFVWRNPEVSISVSVRPDGKVSTPLVEDLQAAGKTPSLLARDIEKALSNFIRGPMVTVIVREFNGNVGQRIRVIGEVAQPDVLSFRQGLTLLDVMIAVGGLSEYAAGNRAKIIRLTKDGQREIPVRLDDLLADGDMSANIALFPGDILIVPESFF